jgi:hypothetical protein
VKFDRGARELRRKNALATRAAVGYILWHAEQFYNFISPDGFGGTSKFRSTDESVSPKEARPLRA